MVGRGFMSFSNGPFSGDFFFLGNFLITWKFRKVFSIGHGWIFFRNCGPCAAVSDVRKLHLLAKDLLKEWKKDPGRTGSTIRTLLHEKINPKDWQVLSLGDVGFLLFLRVVSGHYGKPWGVKPQKYVSAMSAVVCLNHLILGRFQV